jgi:hypothetical protein
MRVGQVGSDEEFRRHSWRELRLQGFRFAPSGATPRADQRPLVEGARGRAHVPQHQHALPGHEPGANLALVERLRTVADAIGASVARSQSRGWRRRAPISFPWLASAGAIASTKLSARWISLSRPRISHRWQMRCRPTPFLASAIQSNTSHTGQREGPMAWLTRLRGGREGYPGHGRQSRLRPRHAVCMGHWGHMLR